MLSLHLGILVVVVEVALAHLRWHSESKVGCCIYAFVNAALHGRCRFVQHGPSILPKHLTTHGPAGTPCKSRHFAIGPRSTFSVFCFSNNHVVRLLLCGGVPATNEGHVCISLHWSQTCESTAPSDARRPQDFRSSFDSSQHIQVGSDVLPASAKNCPCKHVV